MRGVAVSHDIYRTAGESPSLTKVLTHLGWTSGFILVAFPIGVTLIAATHGVVRMHELRLLPLPSGGPGEDPGGAARDDAPIRRLGPPVVAAPFLQGTIKVVSITTGKIANPVIAAFAIVGFGHPLRSFFLSRIFLILMLPVEVHILPTFADATRLPTAEGADRSTGPVIWGCARRPCARIRRAISP